MDQFRQNKTNINKSNKRRKNVKEKFNKDNLENELKKLKDDNLRHLAEIDNLRKRFDKEKEDIFKYAITDFANEIILVVDNFERVIDNISSIDKKNNEKLKSLINGIELTFKDFISTLEKFEIKKIDALGKKFDPNFHQAIFEDQETEKTEGEIIKVIQSGYTIKERLLRPASVGIAKKKTLKKKIIFFVVGYLYKDKKTIIYSSLY